MNACMSKQAHPKRHGLQAWRVPHPPVRGHPWLFTRPLVHVGFLKSWLAGGFNTKVVARVMHLVTARPPLAPGLAQGKPLRIYITGGYHCTALNAVPC